MSKYHAKKTVVDGITFDSKKEAQRYAELKLLEKAGEISNLKLQPVFELQPMFSKNGKTYRGITYIGDFMYWVVGGSQWVIEDVKGVQTEVFKIKRKLFEMRYPNHTLKIV